MKYTNYVLVIVTLAMGIILSLILIFAYTCLSPGIIEVIQLWSLIIPLMIVFLQFGYYRNKESKEEKELIKLVFTKLKYYFYFIVREKIKGRLIMPFHSMPFFIEFNRVHPEILLKLGIEIYSRERAVEEYKKNDKLDPDEPSPGGKPLKIIKTDFISILRILETYKMQLGTGRYVLNLETMEYIKRLDQYPRFEEVLEKIREFATETYKIKINEKWCKFSKSEKERYNIK